MKKPVPVTIDDLEATADDDKSNIAIHHTLGFPLVVTSYQTVGPKPHWYAYEWGKMRVTRVRAIELLEGKL